MAEFYVEQQYWKHWPKVLIMCRKNGRDVTRRRYVPEVETEEGTSITDELRHEVANYPFRDNRDFALFEAVADRIDEEHERACAEAWDNGYESDYLGIEKWLTEHPQVMEQHGWVKLPKDADGECIRIGDVMEWVRYEDDDPTIVRNVVAVGADVFFAWSDEQGRYAQYEAHAYRHHHAPTVEDVLRDMHMELDEVTALYVGEAIDSDERDRDEARIFAKYASKLRLAGEDA